MDRKNIAFFFPYPLCEVLGGTERVSCTLADELVQRGHEVFFVAYEDAKGRRACEGADYSRQYFISRKNIRQAFPLFIKEHKIEWVIYQDGAVPLPFSIPRELDCRLSVVLHYAPDFYTQDYWKNFLERRLPRPLKRLGEIFRRTPLNTLGLWLLRWRIGRVYAKLLRSCDRFVLLSAHFSPCFRALVGNRVPASEYEKVRAIPNPSVPVAVSPGTEKKRELLFVGRLENGQKRVDLLLKIWASLETRFPEWTLRIVGNGPDAANLRALAGTLGLNRARFEGFCDPMPYYANASIFCMTSSYEGFGLVLAESMGAGCVPVAFLSGKTAVFEDIISTGENGILVPEGDIDRYTEALAELMSDSALRERLSVAATRKATDFSPKKIAECWDALFHECKSSR